MHRREALAATGAAMSAALGSLALNTLQAAAAPSAISAELERLISAKADAYTAFIAALDAEQALDQSFLNGRPEVLIPLSIGGAQSLYVRSDDLDRSAESTGTEIRQRYADEVRRLNTAARVSPAAIEQATADLNRALDADLRTLAKAVRAERKARRLSGYQQASDARDKACDADSDALTALCAYRCTNMADVEAKMQAIAEEAGPSRGDLQSWDWKALMTSFAPLKGGAI